MERLDPQRLSQSGARSPCALIVDDDPVGRIALRKLLSGCGYETRLAHNGAEGVEQFCAAQPDVVFMDMQMPVMDGLEATARIKAFAGERFVPVIFLTGNSDGEDHARCIDAGGDDFLVKPYNATVLKAKLRAMERIADLHRRNAHMHARMEEEQALAKSILEGAIMGPNALPAALIAHLSPATTFNGDLLLSAYSPVGDLHVLLGDFTGHGLAATIGALPAAETFRAMTAKGFGPAKILTEINRKLRALLPTGRFLAAIFLCVDRSLGRVSVINCGMPEAWLICGLRIEAGFDSMALPLAVSAEDDYEAAEISVQVRAGDRIMLVSDGAIEVGDAQGGMLGADALRVAIEGGLADGDPIAAAVRAIDEFRCGVALADDASLVDIHLIESLFPATLRLATPEQQPAQPEAGDSVAASAGAGWRVTLELRGHALRETGPVPLLMSLLKEFPGGAAQSTELFTVLAELYNNALDHGVLQLDSRLKSEDFTRYLDTREARLEKPGEGRVSMQLDCEYGRQSGQIEIRVEDSGSGFDLAGLAPAAEDVPHGRGIRLVRELCESVRFEGVGNRVCAKFACRSLRGGME